VGGLQSRVEKRGEYIEAAKSVCEDMVQHDRHRGSAIGKITDQSDRPERSLPRQRSHDHCERSLQQRPLIPWRSAGHRLNMMIDIEVTIVYPHWPSAARRHLDQLLTQARKSNDAVCDQLLEVRQAEIAGPFQDQDDSELLRSLAGVHRQKRQVSGTGARNCRPVPARHLHWRNVPRRHIPIRHGH
jgi:hypothetical protein